MSRLPCKSPERSADSLVRELFPGSVGAGGQGCPRSVRLIAAAALLLVSALAALPQQIRLMQWNVHGNIGTVNVQSSAGAAAIARILNYLQPDVVLLNEVDDGSVLTNTTSLTYWVSTNLPYMASGPYYVSVSTESSSIQRNAVLSRYPVLSPFTYPDVSTSLRGMFSFQLQLAGTNLLQVFHVHLKCCSDGTSCTEKQDEAQLFSDDIKAWAATNSIPYIFAGDLNEDEQNPECTLSATYHPITTLITNGALTEFKPTTLDGEYRTWTTANASPSIRFDYILAATNRLAPISGRVFSTANWAAHGLYTNASPQNLANDSATASDHYCVFADYLFATNPLPTLQSIQTVFVIMMENQNWSSIKGSTSAPYLNNVVLPMASHAEQYYNPPATHPSLPNYLWLEAGTNFGILDDNPPSINHQGTTNHLVTLLKNAGISWRAYQEDICGCFCPLADTNLYAVRHDPFVYFDDLTGTNNSNSASCITNIRPYSELLGDLQSNLVARYNFITPNTCNDMHDSTGCPTPDSIKNGDTWLSTNLPAILGSQAYTSNGAIFILWDEGISGDGPIGMIALSPLGKGSGYFNSAHYTHSSTLRTIQEIFGVGPLLADAGNAADLSDLFNVAAGQLSVTPASGLTFTGSAGGPFSPASQSYILSNAGNAVLNWTVTNAANWLTLSPTSGTLLPASTAMVSALVNTNANALFPGAYLDSIGLTNLNNGISNTTRSVTLTVTTTNGQLVVTPPSGLAAVGQPGGPFVPVTQTYTLSNAGSASLDWLATKSANWLTLSSSSGTLAPAATTAVVASINSNANTLLPGAYADAISFTNISGGLGSTTRPMTLTISTSAPHQVSIAYLRSLEDTTTWQPTDKTTLFGITGVITTFTNITGGTTASYYIQDATAGINLFVTGDASFRPTMGDIVNAAGTLSSFDQNLELAVNATNATQSYSIIGHTNLLPAPCVFGDFTQTNNAPFMETNLEGRLVMLTNVYFSGLIPTNVGTASIDLVVTNSAGVPFDVRMNSSIDRDLRNTIRSRFAWTITGVMVQFLNSATYANRTYQVVVTRFADIVTNRPPSLTSNIALSNNNVLLTWPAVPYVTNYARPGAYAYSVFAATSLDGPFSPLATGLTFNSTNGAYVDTNPPAANIFYKVSSP